MLAVINGSNIFFINNQQQSFVRWVGGLNRTYILIYQVCSAKYRRISSFDNKGLSVFICETMVFFTFCFYVMLIVIVSILQRCSKSPEVKITSAGDYIWLPKHKLHVYNDNKFFHQNGGKTRYLISFLHEVVNSW